MTLTRRALVHTLGTSASLGWIEGPAADGSVAQATADRIVYMGGDGIGLSPRGYTSLLDDLTRKLEVREDNYLLGGGIEASNSTGPRCSRTCSTSSSTTTSAPTGRLDI